MYMHLTDSNLYILRVYLSCGAGGQFVACMSLILTFIFYCEHPIRTLYFNTRQIKIEKLPSKHIPYVILLIVIGGFVVWLAVAIANCVCGNCSNLSI